ncbi:MAG: cbb3-type cytochrome oxidase assembly protein CcoS [Pseudomonadota bacterium]
MEILALLVPLSLVLVSAALWALRWAADHEQFDDLDKHGMDLFSEGDESL